MGEYYNEDLEIFNTLDTTPDNDNVNDDKEPIPQKSNEEDSNTPPQEESLPEDFDLIKEALKLKGFNPDAIRIADEETDTIQTVSFDELSNEEKLELLNLQNDALQLNSDEEQIVSFMRENEIDLDTLINYYKQEGIKEYLANEGAIFKVDDLSDDEIYALSLKDMYEELTEDEIADEVNRAKENESLFQKKVSKLRDQYKEREIEEQQKQEAQNQPDPQEMETFISNIKQSAQQVKTIGGFDLEDEDINKSIDYLVKPTLTGQTKLISDLNNPSQVFKLAFYMTHGDALIESIHEQYSTILNDEKYLKDRLEKLNKTKKPKSNNKSNLTLGGDKKQGDSTEYRDDLKQLLNLK